MKAVFLDRDGVINRFPGHGAYVTRIGDFRFIPQSRKALKALAGAGFKIFVISNQAGVARGRMTLKKMRDIDAHMRRQLSQDGVEVRSYYCPHHPDEGCACRKPGLGNVRRALAGVGKSLRDVRDCFFVGDSAVDVQTGRAAGLKTIMVLSGKSVNEDAQDNRVQPDHVAANLAAAVRIILHENPRHPRQRRSRA